MTQTTLGAIADAAEMWRDAPNKLNTERLENLIARYRNEAAQVTLTPRQKCAFNFIREHIAEHGIAPSYQEMCDAIGLAGRSAAHRLIKALEVRGYIRRLPNKFRAIEIVGGVE